MVFNPKLTIRDGLMEQEIRRATGCSTDAAGGLIEREVEALQARLSGGEQVDFPGLGRLFQQPDGLTGFAAEPRLGERYAAPGLGRIPWLDRSIMLNLRQAETETAAKPTPVTQGGPHPNRSGPTALTLGSPFCASPLSSPFPCLSPPHCFGVTRHHRVQPVPRRGRRAL